MCEYIVGLFTGIFVMAICIFSVLCMAVKWKHTSIVDRFGLEELNEYNPGWLRWSR